MGKKLATIVACAFAAVLFAVPAPAWASVPSTAIYVNGVDITSHPDNRVECGGGYAELNPQTGVLVLNNATITKSFINDTGWPTVDTHFGIYGAVDVNLDIELVGENTMTCGIQAFGNGGSGGDISISGGGSLTIDSDMWGIHAYEHLEIDGTSVFVETHGRHALKSDADSISIQGGAHVEATSTSIESDSAHDCAMRAGNSNPSAGDIVVSGTGTYLKVTVNDILVDAGYGAVFAHNDFIVRDGATAEVTGIAYAVNDIVVQGAALSVVLEDRASAILASQDILFENATVYADGHYGRAIDARGGFSAKNSTITASSLGEEALYSARDAVLDGGTATLTAETRPAVFVPSATVTFANGIFTLKGAPKALFVGALDLGSDWYQWSDLAIGTPVSSADTPYDLSARSDAYLRIEPVGTTYELNVTDGEGGGSYVAGTQVTVSAADFNANGHFSGWVVNSDPTGAGVLDDDASGRTTFTMPAGTVELAATFNDPHILEHVEADEPSCTAGGTAEHWKCSKCGALFSDSTGTKLVDAGDLTIPASGHSWGEPKWSWDDDYTKFVATFACSNDPSHTEVLTAEPTASVKTEPTCTEPGVRLYTATVELEGVEYVATSEQSIPALGHDYVDGVCTACGEKDPDYAAPEDPEKSDATIPATGDASALFSLVPTLLGGSALAAGVVARRRR